MSNRPDSLVLICTATVAADATAGSFANVTITDDPSITGDVRFVVPSGQTWIFEDLYISTAGGSGATVDPIVRIYKGGGRIMANTPPLSNLLVSNNSRPPYSNKKIGYRGTETISMQVITTVANDTVADSITFFVRVSVF